MSARCPEGHLSHDPDYCDHCGVRIVAGQENYGYRSEEPAGRGAATGGAGYGGGGAAGGGDAYGRRGYGDDPLGIRRAPVDPRGAGEAPPGYAEEPPARGSGFFDGEGYGEREAYRGRDGYGEPEARPARDRGDRDGYRGRDGYGEPEPRAAAPAPGPAAERGYAEDLYGGETLSRRRGGERPEAGGPGTGYEQPGYPAGRDEYGQSGYGQPEYGQNGFGQPEYGRTGRDEAPAPAPGRSRNNDPYGGYGGDPLPARGAAAPAPSAPDVRLLPCPNCRTPHDPNGRFCDTCGMDFATGHVPGSAEAAPMAPAAPPRSDDRRGAPYADPARSDDRRGSAYAEPPRIGDRPRVDDRLRTDDRSRVDDGGRVDDRDGYADPRRPPTRGRGWEESRGGAGAVATGWEAVVEAERDYYDSGDDHRVPFPAFYPRRVFALTGPELLVGRRSDSRGIHPEIDLSGAPEDPGVSRAHAIFQQLPDGSYAVRDPGSTNGTRLNDEPEPIEANQPVPLEDGDRVYLGAWTRITVRAR